MPTKSKSKMWVMMLAVVVVLVVVGYYLWQNGWKVPGFGSDGWSSYQAIFLSNGQVYFGKASNLNSNYVNLKDVYYLQVSQVLQPVQGKKEPQPTQSISLAKLGASEIHRPTDEMMINRDQVLFIETMTTDSQVVQAIKSYKENLAKQAAK